MLQASGYSCNFASKLSALLLHLLDSGDSFRNTTEDTDEMKKIQVDTKVKNGV